MADQPNDNIWLKRAQDAYSGSTSYFDSYIRPQVEANLRQVQGKHPSNSKYNSDAYKARSKLFRPKTRTMTRKNEAIAAAAFFSNEDAVSIRPMDDSNPLHLASSEIMGELVQYRLTKTIPWFQLVIGAYQDAMVSGVVASHQYWKYDAKRGIDQPCIDLIPIENLRFDPAADWIDPINTSPYVIRLIPMYAKDIKARMKAVDQKTGESKWKPLTDAQILSASKNSYDSIRQQREGNRVDPKENSATLSEYQMCWVHQNFVEVDGVDYIYYTLGIEHILSEPVELKTMYAHGVRPIALGCSVIEAHKVYPTAPVELVHDVQVEINEIANQRIDNVKFAMNKRYFAKRNSQVDIRSLTRNVPSSVTLMNDINDVKVIETNDVTSSSYQEQDRLNLDFDDLAGAFSGSSVQANRKLNETVGGMTLLSQGANEISEYQLRTFVETWAEKVLRQLVLLEQQYETDETILIFAGTRAKLFEKYGINEITDELLEREMVVTVNVGVGSTNPQAQFEKFITGMRALAEMMASDIGEKLNVEEVTKEIFGKLGYKDGARFFTQTDDDPRVAQLQQKLQEMQTALDAKLDPEIRDATVKKLLAEAEAIKAGTVNKNVSSEYAAMQAGQVVASMPTVAPVADEILKGAGFVPVAGDGVQMSDVPANANVSNAPNVVQNTSPMSPPLPQGGMNGMHGIETQANDGVIARADGGTIQGAGTSTSDSVPIMASTGEGVLNAEAMQLLGEDTLNYLNEIGLQMRNAQHLADGGIVESIKQSVKELFTGTTDAANEKAKEVKQDIEQKSTPPFVNKLNDALGVPLNPDGSKK